MSMFLNYKANFKNLLSYIFLHGILLFLDAYPQYGILFVLSFNYNGSLGIWKANA